MSALPCEYVGAAAVYAGLPTACGQAGGAYASNHLIVLARRKKDANEWCFFFFLRTGARANDSALKPLLFLCAFVVIFCFWLAAGTGVVVTTDTTLGPDVPSSRQ